MRDLINNITYVKTFIAWKCKVCDAIFEFDSSVEPVRCPDCLSSREYLSRVEGDHAACDDSN